MISFCNILNKLLKCHYNRFVSHAAYFTKWQCMLTIMLSSISCTCIPILCIVFEIALFWWGVHNLFHRKTDDFLLVVVVSIHFRHTPMTNFSMAIFTSAWWWGLQSGGAFCARAHCALLCTLDNPALYLPLWVNPMFSMSAYSWFGLY